MLAGDEDNVFIFSQQVFKVPIGHFNSSPSEPAGTKKGLNHRLL